MDFAISPVFLVLWYIVPGNAPDIRTPPIPKATVEECVQEGMEFRAHGIPDSLAEKGITDIAFTCAERVEKKT